MKTYLRGCVNRDFVKKHIFLKYFNDRKLLITEKPALFIADGQADALHDEEHVFPDLTFDA